MDCFVLAGSFAADDVFVAITLVVVVVVVGNDTLH